jgi:hypothetical protein
MPRGLYERKRVPDSAKPKKKVLPSAHGYLAFYNDGLLEEDGGPFFLTLEEAKAACGQDALDRDERDGEYSIYPVSASAVARGRAHQAVDWVI